MICPKCEYPQDDLNTECPRCGIVFEKYRRHQATDSSKTGKAPGPDGRRPGAAAFLGKLLFSVRPGISPLPYAGRIAVLLVILVWGGKLALSPLGSDNAGNSFLHLVNLPFHEAGHLVFRPFGEVMGSLGGSLGQLLVPLVCLVAFLVSSRDTFGASVSLWWFGENFMDIAPYIDDARALTMPLLGGNTGATAPYGFHDWQFILTELGWLHHDHSLAAIACGTGTVIMFISVAWAGYLLYRQFDHITRPGA